MAISPVLRRLAVGVSSQLAAVSVGGAVTYPTLLMQSFHANGTTIRDVDTKSWIGSISGLAGIPAILMPIIAQKIGRKLGYIVTCILLMLGWIQAIRATTITELLISESFHGLSTNSLVSVCFIGVSEMLAPKYRAHFMQTFGIAQGIGMAACGILGRYFDYSTVGIIMLVPIVFATAIAFIWAESPAWFACKGQFDRCERAFVKLRGTDELSNKELKELITAQKEYLRCQQPHRLTTIQNMWKQITSRDFYMPSLHTVLLFLAMYWSGCNVIYVYFIDIVEKSTDMDSAAFYAGIVMYLIVISGLIVRDILLLRFKNKTMLVISACCVIFCLLASSLISGLQTLGILKERSLLLMYCLIAFTASASLGLNGLVFIISSELMPVRHRSLGGALYIIINCILYATSLNISPYITEHVGLWCTFLIFALNGCFCTWAIWKYVPETKGRLLQEIEDYYTHGKFIKRHIDNGSPDNNKFISTKEYMVEDSHITQTC